MCDYHLSHFSVRTEHFFCWTKRNWKKTFLLSVPAVCNPRALNLTFFLGKYYKNLFLTNLKKNISFFTFNFMKLALVIEKTSTLLGQGFRRLFYGTVYGVSLAYLHYHPSFSWKLGTTTAITSWSWTLQYTSGKCILNMSIVLPVPHS